MMNKKAANTILTLVTVLAFMSVLFGLVANTSGEILGNPLLDDASTSNLGTLVGQVQSIDISGSTITNNITINSTFEGTDAFQREFLESKSIAEGENKNIIEKTTGVPNVLLTALGIPQDVNVTLILAIIGVVLLIIIGLVVFKGWKTGQVD